MASDRELGVHIDTPANGVRLVGPTQARIHQAQRGLTSALGEQVQALSGGAVAGHECGVVLENDPNVFRYAWFSADPIPEAELFDDAGRLTSLDRTYVGLPHNPACGE